MPYKPIESNAFTFVLYPSGDLRGYKTYDVIERLYYDERKIIDSKWQKNRNLKDVCYKMLFDISEGEQPAPNKVHYYIAMDSTGMLKCLPLRFNAFNIPSFKNKIICLKAIRRIQNKFTKQEIIEIFKNI